MKSIKLKQIWIDAISQLPAEVRCEIYAAISFYTLENQVPAQMSDLARGAFAFIKADIDCARQRTARRQAKADALPYRPEPQSKEEASLPTVPSAKTAETAELSAETKRQKEKARPPYQAPTPPANRPAPPRRSFASVMKRRISQRRRA